MEEPVPKRRLSDAPDSFRPSKQLKEGDSIQEEERAHYNRDYSRGGGERKRYDRDDQNDWNRGVGERRYGPEEPPNSNRDYDDDRNRDYNSTRERDGHNRDRGTYIRERDSGYNRDSGRYRGRDERRREERRDDNRREGRNQSGREERDELQQSNPSSLDKELLIPSRDRHKGNVPDYEPSDWNLVRARDREHIRQTKLTLGLPEELEEKMIESLEVEYRHAKAYSDAKFFRYKDEMKKEGIEVELPKNVSFYQNRANNTDNELALGNVYKYNCLQNLGGGTFSNVFLAEDAKKNQFALKKLKMGAPNAEKSVEREIEALKACKHDNVIELIELVANSQGQKFLVLEYCDHDLKSLLSGQALSPREAKQLLLQLLNGLDHVHSKNIIHRDLKPDNLLVSRKGILKIADFGSARFWERGANHTPGMTTLRYRAPEILLGSEKYDKTVDMWSVGCIFAEMQLGKPLIEGTSEADQIEKMCALLGSFKERWGPGFLKLPFSKNLVQMPQPTNYLKTHMGVCSELTDKGFDLLNNFLRYDPIKRFTTTKALAHNYFSEEPVITMADIRKKANSS